MSRRSDVWVEVFEEHGLWVNHTGGGCTAWYLHPKDGHYYGMITGIWAEVPTAEDEHITAGVYEKDDDDGVYEHFKQFPNTEEGARAAVLWLKEGMAAREHYRGRWPIAGVSGVRQQDSWSVVPFGVNSAHVDFISSLKFNDRDEAREFGRSLFGAQFTLKEHPSIWR